MPYTENIYYTPRNTDDIEYDLEYQKYNNTNDALNYSDWFDENFDRLFDIWENITNNCHGFLEETNFHHFCQYVYEHSNKEN